jgi:hypothetical protein
VFDIWLSRPFSLSRKVTASQTESSARPCGGEGKAVGLLCPYRIVLKNFIIRVEARQTARVDRRALIRVELRVNDVHGASQRVQ